MEGVEQLAIRGTNVILIEMPAHRWESGLYETLVALRDECGLHPVLAHLNRYPTAQGKTLIPYGFDIQLNADGIVKAFDRPTRMCLKHGRIVALGSDLHERNEGAVRDFNKAQAKLGARAEAIFAASGELLAGAIPLGKESL
jgi:tyrosine-protein phosphatase YwqE